MPLVLDDSRVTKKKTTNKYKKFTRIYAVGDKPILDPGLKETDWQTDRKY